jgi:serine/threonine protein kinase
MIYPEHYDQTTFIRELEALMALNHPCVCRIVGWSPPIGTNEAEIHMELAENRSLASVLERVRWGAMPAFWTATGKAIIICGIALGMRFVHSKGYIHRDLKPSNILINGRGEALISDFGTARSDTYDATLTPDCGSVQYGAPESFIEDAEYSDRIDVFSFGPIVYEILTEKAALPTSMSPFEVIRLFQSGHMPSIPESCGPFMQTLIDECWSRDPQVRPSFHRIIERIQHADFEIVPGASHSILRGYVTDILSQSNSWAEM